MKNIGESNVGQAIGKFSDYLVKFDLAIPLLSSCSKNKRLVGKWMYWKTEVPISFLISKRWKQHHASYLLCEYQVLKTPAYEVGVSKIEHIGAFQMVYDLVGCEWYHCPYYYLMMVSNTIKFREAQVNLLFHFLFANEYMLHCPMQFTRSGHTQLTGNAIMITSTITVVLFSTVVRKMTYCPCTSLPIVHLRKYLSY